MEIKTLGILKQVCLTKCYTRCQKRLFYVSSAPN